MSEPQPVRIAWKRSTSDVAIEIGGIDIVQAAPISRATLHLDARGVLELVLSIDLVGIPTTIEGQAAVRVDSQTATALRALGWTPRDDEGARP
jgi:hypothetical protein